MINDDFTHAQTNIPAMTLIETISPSLSGEAAVESEDHRGAETATMILKAMGHDGRLRILAYLAEADRSVSELEQLLGQRQAAVSQQLARLRRDNLVETQRHGKTIIYRLGSGLTREPILQILQLFGIVRINE